MPRGLKFQRKHRKLGYRIKYLYYFLARRDVLQKKVSYGDMNPNDIIYLIKPDFQDGVEGLLSLIFRQLLYISMAKKNGYIPYVDWKNYKTQYYDGRNNVWEYFFKQPSNLNENEIYRSKNVYLSGWTFRTINPEGLFEAEVFSDNRIRRERVYIRGTDYVKLKPSGEYVQPSVNQMKCKIWEFENKYNAPIFLVTEDGDIFDELKSEFGEIIKIVSFDTFIRNYEGKEVLSKSDVLEKDKKLRGQKYLAKMILLAKCKYFVGSMTQGSKFSYILNNGNYSDEYVFDLGLYP